MALGPYHSCVRSQTCRISARIQQAIGPVHRTYQSGAIAVGLPALRHADLRGEEHDFHRHMAVRYLHYCGLADMGGDGFACAGNLRGTAPVAFREQDQIRRRKLAGDSVTDILIGQLRLDLGHIGQHHNTRRPDPCHQAKAGRDGTGKGDAAGLENDVIGGRL